MAGDPHSPLAKIVPAEVTVHGDTRVDNYFWLRDRTDPEVIATLDAENQYTEEVMARTKPLQEALYKEILGRIKETDLSVPVKRDDYFYYARTEEGQAYAIYCRKKGSLDASEEVLLDASHRLPHRWNKTGLRILITRWNGPTTIAHSSTRFWMRPSVHIRFSATNWAAGRTRWSIRKTTPDSRWV